MRLFGQAWKIRSVVNQLFTMSAINVARAAIRAAERGIEPGLAVEIARSGATMVATSTSCTSPSPRPAVEVR